MKGNNSKSLYFVTGKSIQLGSEFLRMNSYVVGTYSTNSLLDIKIILKDNCLTLGELLLLLLSQQLFLIKLIVTEKRK